MEEFIFNKDTWEFINSFAPWLSAIGTILAVIVSLYLARRDKLIKLKVSAGHRLFISPGMRGQYPEFLYISVVNKGFQEAQLTNIGWKIGLFKKQHAIQSIIQNDGISSSMPIRLKNGEEAKYFIPLNEETNWINNFVEQFLKSNHRRRINHIRIQAFTSIDKVFESKIDKSLKKKILEAI